MIPQVAPPVTELPTKVILLNASSLKVSACQLRYHNTVVLGMRSKTESEYLTFGKAVHKYAERRSKGFDHGHALMFAMEEYKGEKTPQLIMACTAMPPALVTPLTDESGPFVERKFKIYWYSITYKGVQYDIYVCGTLDVLGQTAEALRITDYKTARKYKAEEVFADYRTSV